MASVGEVSSGGLDDDIPARARRVHRALLSAIMREFSDFESDESIPAAQKPQARTQLVAGVADLIGRSHSVLVEYVNQAPSAEEIAAAADPAAPEAADLPEAPAEPAVYLVGDTEIDLEADGISHPDVVFLLEIIAELDKASFARKDVFERDFMADYSLSARSKAFLSAVRSLAAKLETLVGEPVIKNEGYKKYSRYVLLVPIRRLARAERPEPVLVPAPEPAAAAVPELSSPGAPVPDPEAEVFDEPEELDDEPSEEDLSLLEEAEDDDGPEDEPPVLARAEPVPRRAPDKKPQPARRPPVIRSSNGHVSLLADHLDESELRRLADVWAGLQPRRSSEVLQNMPVKLAIQSILDRCELTDYRPKVVIPVRFGIYPDKYKKQPVFVRRNGSSIRLQEIMANIPSGQGVSLATASQILGLKTVAVLRTEADFLKAYRAEFEALKPLHAAIQSELDTLEQLRERAAAKA